MPRIIGERIGAIKLTQQETGEGIVQKTGGECSVSSAPTHRGINFRVGLVPKLLNNPIRLQTKQREGVDTPTIGPFKNDPIWSQEERTVAYDTWIDKAVGKKGSSDKAPVGPFIANPTWSHARRDQEYSQWLDRVVERQGYNPNLPVPVGKFINIPSASVTENLSRYDVYLNEIATRDEAHRSAEMARGKVNYINTMSTYGLPPETSIFQFYLFQESEAMRQKQTLQLKGQLPDRTRPVPIVRQRVPRREDANFPGLIKIQHKVYADGFHEQLKADAEKIGFSALAERIRTKQWKDNKKYPQSFVETRDRQAVEIDETTGAVVDRSFAGAALVHRAGNEINTLVMGIEYVGKTDDMPQGMQTQVSDSDLQRGVKSYVLERVREVRVGQGTKVIEKRRYVVPALNSDALSTYVQFMYDETNEVVANKEVGIVRRGRQQQLLAA